MQPMPSFGLPRLDHNPFSTMPLEAGEENKLVGREDEFLQLKNFLKYRSPRRLMLVGPLGSGRTSLLRCLQPYAASFATVEHLPVHSPAESLLQTLYVQLIGRQPPHHWSEMVQVLVNECASMSRGLPLVVVDVPASDTSVLSVALRDTLAVLERLNALVVIVCDHQERRQLPNSVTGLFDQVELRPLHVGHVLELVHQRMAAAGQSAPEFNEEQARALLAGCDGYPQGVVTVLRNAVDVVRMGTEGPAGTQFSGVPAKPMPRNGPYALGVLSGSSTPPEPFSPVEEVEPSFVRDVNVGPMARTDSSSPMADAVEDANSLPLETTGVPLDANINEAALQPSINRDSLEVPRKQDEAYPPSLLDPLDPEILDASTPWKERKEKESPPNQSVSSGFGLDFDRLKKEQLDDEPLLPLPSASPLTHESNPRPPLPKGAFGGLVRRNRLGAPDSSLGEGTGGLGAHGLVKEGHDDTSEFWVSPGTLFSEPIEEEDEPATMLHDEEGWTTQHDEVLLNTEATVEGTSSGPGLDQTSFQPTSLPTTLPPFDQEKFEEVHAMLRALVMNLDSDRSGSLISFFEGRQKPRTGAKEGHPLNHIALNALDMREAYVLDEARHRWVSPSDPTVLEHLGVKRSRLSQICNRLFRLGILESRRVGKYRKYKLTKAAEAQLIAWGALEEVMA